MIRTPDGKRKYRTAHERFLKPAIVNFFSRELAGLFGPIVRENIAEELVKLFDSLCPDKTRLKPGQMIWNALDRSTRADSKNRRYKPVVLTVVSDQDITMFENQKPIPEIRKHVIARMIREAYAQGGILSTRDLSLILTMKAPFLSQQRIEYEEQYQTVLPHTGVIHDMGTTLTHKRQIIYKYVVEKKDPRVVASETNHSQLAVDRYIKDFNRVKILLNDNKDIDFIHLTTNISKSVIKQYQQIFKQYVKEHI